VPVLIDVIRLAFWAIEFIGYAVYASRCLRTGT